MKRSADLMLTISLGTPVSLSLVNRLASLLFFSSGETASKEDDVSLSFLFGGIKLQGLTRQMADHQKYSPYSLTIPSLPPKPMWGCVRATCSLHDEVPGIWFTSWPLFFLIFLQLLLTQQLSQFYQLLH